MRRKAPNGQKICYLLQTNLKIPPFMCNLENNFNHFVHLQEIPEGFYTDNQKQSAYKGGVAQMMTLAIHFNQTRGSIYYKIIYPPMMTA
jgi:hypothetical protein